MVVSIAVFESELINLKEGLVAVFVTCVIKRIHFQLYQIHFI